MSFNSLLPWMIAQAQPAAEIVADAAAADVPVDETSVALRLLAAVGVIVGSFVVGGFLARSMRLPDFSFKIGLVLFTIAASAMVCWSGWPPKRGIDLSGGVVLVYEVDRGLSKPSWMPTAISQLNDDLNEGSAGKVEARPLGADQIEIVAPEGFDPARVDRAVLALRSTADLTLIADGKRTDSGKTIFKFKVDEQHKAVEMDKLIAAVGRRINPGGVKELTLRQYGAEQLEIIIPEVEKREVEQIKKRISTSGLLEFRIAANENDDRDIIRAAAKTAGDDVYIGGKLVGRWVQAGKDFALSPEALGSFRDTEAHGREVLVRIDPYNVDGHYLNRASANFDEGRPSVHFSFDAAGAQRFGQLTRNNLPDPATGFYRHLGIVLDNVILSAPRIESTIHGSGQITGKFTQEEVDNLVGILNAGSLPATLRPEPISEQRISAQLGDDTIRQGSRAMLISTAAVLVFMAIYYRFAGLVADFGVVMNILLTVALMILIKAAFTLPGLAGMALTVGMAVDANVLIYERMREELARGASLRMAIRNGFAKATSTIIDSNVTTLITAMVLYVIGTDQIKGFAVTLIIGLCVSMFTAIVVARLIFDIAEKKRWLTRLRMMQIVGETHIDFIRWRMPAIVGSVLLIAVGLAAAAARGRGLLDIDFTGGSSVHMLFAEGKGQDIAAVRKAVENLPDVAVSSVGENNLQYKVDTSEGDIRKVEGELQETFGDSLQTYSMSFGELATIEAPKEEAPKDEAPKEEAKPAGEAKPADEPKTDEKPSESNPSESKPTEEPAPQKPAATDEAPKAEQPPASDAPKTSRGPDRGRAAFQLASFDVGQALAALSVAQDAAPPAADAKKTDEPAKPEEAKADSSQDSKEKPAETPAAPAAEEKPAEPAPAADSQPAQAAEENAAPGASLVGGTRVAIIFPQTISYDPLAEMIKKQLGEMNLSTASYVLRNPKYQPGSDAAYADWTLEIAIDGAQTRTLLETMQKRLSATPVFPSSNQIGGKVAGDTQLMALYAMLASLVMIVVYVWVRFQNVMFGLAAVLALVHDVLMGVAFLGMSYYLAPYLGFLLVDPFKISLPVVAALLTIVGFSINDTIVIFDRIREVRGKSPDLTADMINLSVNQTLSRTILTSGTVLIATVILYIVGGPGIHGFAYTMVIGVIAGSYSTIYIAAPVLLWLRKPSSEGKLARPTRPLGAESKQAPARGV